ncbi:MULTISPECIES: YidH family protein [Thermodesulfovibrio]|jgi:putative membrane protein|uniref:YidH family protein n=1 Tax=Thermodesulfovibrio TaxID=28261 RepID=UPI0026259763|nr:DUF202 domain-containing protein [Thermodesulfovibrio sp.]
MSEKSYYELKKQNRRVHLANERTFLSWIRTSIGIMAFGFVVEKFGLFLEQLYYLTGKQINVNQGKHSTILGVFLISLGALMGLLAFVRYKKVERQIDTDTYKPSLILDLLLTITLLSVAIFLIIFLIHSL